MKYVDGSFHIIDEKTEEYLPEPFFSTEDGRRAADEHVYFADWKDYDGQHEAVESAAKDGKKGVVCISCGDDNYYFVNESRLRKVRKSK